MIYEINLFTFQIFKSHTTIKLSDLIKTGNKIGIKTKRFYIHFLKLQSAPSLNIFIHKTEQVVLMFQKNVVPALENVIIFCISLYD